MASTEPFRIEPDEWYLSRALRKTWNVLLKLDDGKLLPAHSLFLALRMPVFARMLGDGGLLASASTLNVVTVPFSGCSLLEARKFLSVVYSHESAERHINDDTNLSIARISHMYEWKDLVELINDKLALKAGINNISGELADNLEDQDQDVFFHNMTSATLFQMPKLLACYEYYVALHSVDGSRPGLIVQCASEQQLSRSWPRIAKGICMAFQSLASQASRFQNGICTICPPTKRTCECDRGLSTPLEPWEFLPRPMDFFKMAQAAPE